MRGALTGTDGGCNGRGGNGKGGGNGAGSVDAVAMCGGACGGARWQTIELSSWNRSAPGSHREYSQHSRWVYSENPTQPSPSVCEQASAQSAIVMESPASALVAQGEAASSAHVR